MFIKILLNYILGYVNIEVESYYIERFVNLCISKKIFIWNVKRKKSSLLYANISIKDYKRIKNIRSKTKSRIKIKKRCGLPFLLHQYRKRKIFMGFLGTILLTLIILSNFIWNIEIECESNISKEEIIEQLKEEGLKIGKIKGKINLNSIINKIRLKRNDIAWMGISIKGTNAIIKIQAATKAPEVIDENEYCNIISDKEAMITKINVQNGTKLVNEGDIVKLGEQLVGGYVEGKYTGIRYVHACADIEAKVWYSKKEKQPLKQKIKVPTGATEKKYTINFNNFKINFYKTLSKFKKYDTISEDKKLVLFSNFYLPIEIKKTTNYEYEYQDKMYTESELTSIIENKLKDELEDQIKNKENIINIKTNTYNNEGFLEVEVIYEVLENIGSEDKIIY